MGKIGTPGSLRLCPCAVLSLFSCGDVGAAIGACSTENGRIVRSWDSANKATELSDSGGHIVKPAADDDE
jgi:hypothetical protein